MALSGTLRQIILDKVNYEVSADIDLSRTTGKYSKEGQATSGKTNYKLTRQVEMIESVDINVNGTQRENIRDLANALSNFDMAYVTANGDTYTASGQISITADGTADGKMTLTLIPEGEWVAIVV